MKGIITNELEVELHLTVEARLSWVRDMMLVYGGTWDYWEAKYVEVREGKDKKLRDQIKDKVEYFTKLMSSEEE